MEMVTHAINWFEIPVTDFERARDFYSTIFDFEMPTQQMGEHMMGFMPFEMGKGVGGAIIRGEGYMPSQDGAVVYLNGGDDLGTVLDRIEGAGGSIMMGKTLITDDIGYFALFIDSEGNRLALHSRH
jgi:predicted enzyme related to lactoylglutathione lyase